MTQIIIVGRLQNEPSQTKAAQYEGADTDKCCSAYLDSAIHEGSPDTFLQFTIGTEEGVPLIHTGSSKNYHKFETEQNAVTGLYIGRNEFEEDADLDSLSISLGEADGEDFEEATLDPSEEADALFA